jgi:hypothetical protein
LTTAATLSAPTILRGKNLNEKLNLAIIGSGGRGGANMRSLATENIVALCDVNENNLDAAAEQQADSTPWSSARASIHTHSQRFPRCSWGSTFIARNH